MKRQTLSSQQIANMLRGGSRLGPGVWVDAAGALHFSVPELLAFFGDADTPANRARVTAVIEAFAARAAPGAELIQAEEQTH